MRRNILIIIFFFLLFFCVIIPCYAVENDITNSIIDSQKDSLGIGDFISEAEKYTDSNLEDVNLNSVLNEAITGSVKKKGIIQSIIKLFGKEIIEGLNTFATILVIVIIHSIFKSICENLGNGSSGKVAYYIQYLMIVSIILQNFAEIIDDTKETIYNLVRYDE